MGFRLGIIKDWRSRWYAEGNYRSLLHEDLALRRMIGGRYPEAGIADIEIERVAKQLSITIHTARPGIVIGRGGQRVDELRLQVEKLTGKRVRLNIQEVRQPELEAVLVARSIAEQIGRRVAYRRAIKQAVLRTMQRGAQGIKVVCSGRLGGREMSRRETERAGGVPLQTIRADIDYGFAEARTTLGRIGVKVWIYKGDVLPEVRRRLPTEGVAEAAPLRREPTAGDLAP